MHSALVRPRWYDRTSADGARTSADGVRTSAEGLRTSADGVRTSADGVRTSAEGLPTSADGVRTSAEGLRTTAEGVRTTAHAHCDMLRRFPELLLIQRAAWRIRLLSRRGACKWFIIGYETYNAKAIHICFSTILSIYNLRSSISHSSTTHCHIKVAFSCMDSRYLFSKSEIPIFAVLCSSNKILAL